MGVFCQLHVLTLYIMKDNVFNPVFISKILIKDVGKFFFKAFWPSLDFDLEKKIAEPVRIHHGLAEPRWALTHTG